MIVPAPEIENIQVRCLFCTRDKPPGRQISRNDDDLYPRATAFVRKTDENFTNWSKKFEPAAEGRRIFFNVQLSFPNFWHRKMAVGSQQ